MDREAWWATVHTVSPWGCKESAIIERLSLFPYFIVVVVFIKETNKPFL